MDIHAISHVRIGFFQDGVPKSYAKKKGRLAATLYVSRDLKKISR